MNGEVSLDVGAPGEGTPLRVRFQVRGPEGEDPSVGLGPAHERQPDPPGSSVRARKRTPKRQHRFAPQWWGARLFCAPDGRLCYELFYFVMSYPKGGGKTETYCVVHDDLLPRGGTFLLFGIEPVML